MARPSVASLNSLAEVLRQAQPLYTECRSILNYLDPSEGNAVAPYREDTATERDCTSTNKDAASISHGIVEHGIKYAKGVV